MNLPFILNDNGDISLFATVSDLERYVEPDDITSYELFDALGNEMRLSIEKKPKKIMFTHYDIEVVKLSDKITVNRKTYLADLLYPVCIKIDLKFEHSKKSDIPYLISTLINYQGYTK
ncbi:hypothetical protein RO21_09260 [[Actinobacillus] muris]|uniref:Uncharacterized protein n=1 Tax=Muribacter muris TaxID=67855 RepID=A0A0J5P604_9PAST|nr:hypothetical protein [Muribacter muris]KMK50904.1 hypothetical protein RO21_09260 [[Actinobacillus] muris] [Muribacter muris]